jgi:glycosyltransferase involved in cell wall biosynthesis
MADPAAVSVVIPAFNEGGAVGDVVRALGAIAAWREIVVVDDGSRDDTAARAAAAGARVVRHPYNKGNGAAVKTGIRQTSGEFVLLLDADGQHQPADARRLVDRLGDYDLVVGARSRVAQAGAARAVGNALLNRLASFLTEREIPDLTSGMRAARRDCLLEFLPLLPNGFSTPTTTTLAFIKAGYNVGFEPIEVRERVGRSKIRLSRDGVKFLLIVMRVVTIFSPMRVFLPVAAVAFVTGAGYGLWTVIATHKIANGAVLLLLFSVLVFLVGLVSEQVAALRPDGRR